MEVVSFNLLNCNPDLVYMLISFDISLHVYSLSLCFVFINCFYFACCHKHQRNKNTFIHDGCVRENKLRN